MFVGANKTVDPAVSVGANSKLSVAPCLSRHRHNGQYASSDATSGLIHLRTLTLAPRPACQFLSTTLLLARVLGYSGADRVNRQRSSKVPLTGARPRKAVVEAF